MIDPMVGPTASTGARPFSRMRPATLPKPYTLGFG
jgi:hypothetical protein